MNFTKNILIVILLISFQMMNSQNLSTNVQQHIINKYWSNEQGSTGKIIFHFSQNQWSFYINKKKIQKSENYYFTNISCNNPSAIFENSKVGTSSSGNFIKTRSLGYAINTLVNR